MMELFKSNKRPRKIQDIPPGAFITGFVIFFIVFQFLSWDLIILPLEKDKDRLNTEFDTVLINMIITGRKISTMVSELKILPSEMKLKKSLLDTYGNQDSTFILKQLTNNITAHHIDLLSLTSTPESTLDYRKCFKTTMIIQGDYNDLGEYLFSLKDKQVLFQYDKVEIVPIDVKNNTLQMTLALNLYYF